MEDLARTNRKGKKKKSSRFERKKNKAILTHRCCDLVEHEKFLRNPQQNPQTLRTNKQVQKGFRIQGQHKKSNLFVNTSNEKSKVRSRKQL